MGLTKNFLVLSLPRSRTAWLANLLTHDNVFCYHEPMLGCAFMDHFARKFAIEGYAAVGGVDTGACFFIEDIMEFFPAMRLIVIDRDADDCLRSLHNTRLPYVEDLIHKQVELLGSVKEKFNPLVVDFRDMDSMETIKSICTYATGVDFDERRYLMLRDLEIKVDEDKFMANVSGAVAAFNSLLEERNAA